MRILAVVTLAVAVMGVTTASAQSPVQPAEPLGPQATARVQAARQAAEARRLEAQAARQQRLALQQQRAADTQRQREALQQQRQQALLQQQAARQEAAARTQALREEAAALRQQIAADRGAALDARQARQARRIEQGIRRGQLNEAEVQTLRDLEARIVALEEQFKVDDRLTPAELRQLRQILNDASLQIWAQRHDAEANQMPVLRLGVDVFARDELTARIESGELTRPQARSFLQDFRTLAGLRRRLASDDLPPGERERLQAQYNDLLSRYFVAR